MATVRDDLYKAVQAIREGEYNKLAEGLYRRFTSVKKYSHARMEIYRMGRINNEWSQKIADSCQIWVTDSFSDNQRALFQEIESRKQVLKNDNSEVTYSFHGPNDEGLTENTYDGISNTVKISDFPHSSARYGRLLTALASQFSSEPIVELGTCLGTSAAYIGSGIDDGHLTTVEAGEPQVDVARKTISQLGMEDRVTVKNALFQDVLLHNNEVPAFRLAFLDGHHQKDATLKYFRALATTAKKNAVIVFDDVNGYSEGMDDAWQKIREDQQVDLSVLTPRYGFVLLNSDLSDKLHFELPY